MTVYRLKETFRERMPEWVQSLGMLFWGALTLIATGIFGTTDIVNSFYPLLSIMPQTAWGTVAFSIGVIRLIFLFINGAWRPSAHIRAIGCVSGVILWGSLLISTLSLQSLTPTVGIYAMLVLLDLMSLWFAAGDAKLADLSARDKSI